VTTWTPDRIRSIADRMAARLGREVRVSPVTLPLIITALRHYADDLTIAAALGTAEYQVREWDEASSASSPSAGTRPLHTARSRPQRLPTPDRR
jgi:hypothetical protein